MNHLSDLTIDARLAAGEPAPDHAGACAQCRDRWQELARDRQEFLRRARPAAFADAVLARRPARRHFAFLWTLAAAPALLLLLWAWPRDGERFKGAVAVELYVKSEGRTTRWEPEGRYRAGDALQVVYSAAQPYYFTAVNIDGGRPALLARGTAPLPAGARKKLDRSFVLDEAAGDERIFILFSEQPLDQERVLRAVRDSAGAELAVPAAAQMSFLIKRDSSPAD